MFEKSIARPVPSRRIHRAYPFRQALCGAKIVKAYFAFTWDTVLMGKIIIREEKVCHKCLEVVATRSEPGKKYLYGAINGSEGMERPAG
jgi:hypothetical protein